MVASGVRPAVRRGGHPRHAGSPRQRGTEQTKGLASSGRRLEQSVLPLQSCRRYCVEPAQDEEFIRKGLRRALFSDGLLRMAIGQLQVERGLQVRSSSAKLYMSMVDPVHSRSMSKLSTISLKNHLLQSCDDSFHVRQLAAICLIRKLDRDASNIIRRHEARFPTKGLATNTLH